MLELKLTNILNITQKVSPGMLKGSQFVVKKGIKL